MIHIATVHFETKKWIDIQLDFIERNIKQEHRVYAYLNGEATSQKDRFYYAECGTIERHAPKLNLLADYIVSVAKENDIIVFMDGDAFPIAPVDDYITQNLQKYEIAAIRQDELFCDKQPHPSFCFTTVGFWKKINGDWEEGYKWIIKDGSLRTDVGGNLLKILEKNNIEWLKIKRTHSLTNHALLYGIYGDKVYHHGNGFRETITRVDRVEPLEKFCKRNFILEKSYNFLIRHSSWRNRYRIQYRFGIKKIIVEHNDKISNRIYNHINKYRDIDYRTFYLE